jgi:pantothenate kinase
VNDRQAPGLRFGLTSLPDFFDRVEGQKLLGLIRSLPAHRNLIAVSGPPGSGKSSLAASLVQHLPDAALVPMDGFHLDDRILEARALRQRKGAVETFDAEGFVALTHRLRQPETEVIHPVFDRTREVSLAGAGVVRPSARFIVIEGNYLLLDQHPWTQVQYDLTVMLSVPRAELSRRLASRWRALGKTDTQIAAHLENDLKNAEFVIRRSRTADAVLTASPPAS